MKYLLEKYRKWRDSRRWFVVAETDIGSLFEKNKLGDRRYYSLSGTYLKKSDTKFVIGSHNEIVNWLRGGMLPEFATPVTQKENEND